MCEREASVPGVLIIHQCKLAWSTNTSCERNLGGAETGYCVTQHVTVMGSNN